MKPVFNNTDIDLNARLSVERFFSFLSDHNAIFSMNGEYIDGKYLKGVEPKPENDTCNKVLNTMMKFKYQLNSLYNSVYELDPASFNGVKGFHIKKCTTYEIECTKFNLGYEYISPFINCIEIELFMDNGTIFIINVPFILVQEVEDIKVLIVPFSNKLSSYEKDDRCSVLPMDSTFVSEMMKITLSNMTPSDMIFNKIIGMIKANRYTYRDDDLPLKNAVRALNMDLRLLDVKNEENLSYPDMPITEMGRDANKPFDKILVTDGVNYRKVSIEDYLTTSELQAIVIRYTNPNGDVFINEISLDDRFVALNSNIYEATNEIKMKDEKLVDETVFKPSAESDEFPIVYGVKRIGFSTLHGFKEDNELEEEIDPKIKDLYKVNKSMAEKIRDFMDKANDFMRRADKNKAVITQAGFQNDFLRSIGDFLLAVCIGGAVGIFMVPAIAILGAITTFAVRRFAKGFFEDREYKSIVNVYTREIKFFEDKKKDYENNPTILSRIDKIIANYEKELDRVNRAYESKKDERESKKNKNYGEGEY